MTLLERPSNCELELGLLTQCVPISFTGPHHTLVWQGWCCDSEYRPAGSRHVYWDHLDVHFLEWPGVGYQGSQVQGACAPVKIKRQGWSALCQGTAYPDIAEPQWCHIPPMQLSSYSAPHRHTMGTIIQICLSWLHVLVSWRHTQRMASSQGLKRKNFQERLHYSPLWRLHGGYLVSSGQSYLWPEKVVGKTDILRAWKLGGFGARCHKKKKK